MSELKALNAAANHTITALMLEILLVSQDLRRNRTQYRVKFQNNNKRSGEIDPFLGLDRTSIMTVNDF